MRDKAQKPLGFDGKSVKFVVLDIFIVKNRCLPGD